MSILVHPHRSLRIVAATMLTLAMIIVGSVGLTRLPGASTPAAAAPKPDVYPSAQHSAGYTLRGQWFGSWRTADGRGFCIEFDKSSPNNRGAVKVGANVPGMNAEQSARMRYVANKYGPTRSRVDGAAAAIYVWQLQNTGRFDRYYAGMVKAKAIPLRIQKRVAQIAAEAKNHGPYTMSATMSAGYVGQKINGVVTVKARNGRAAAGHRVRLSVNANGAGLAPAATTNARGQVRFSLRVARPGAVRMVARLTTPDMGVWITRPSAGHQRLILQGRSVMTSQATASSQRSVGGPALNSVCTSDCRGTAPVQISRTNACGSAVLRQFLYSNGKPVPGGVMDVGPCKTVRKSVQLPDNALVTTRYCYLDANRRCTTAPIASSGSLRVICPPLVEYRFAGTCPCDQVKTMTYSVRAPATSVRAFRVTQTRTGKSGRQVNTVTLKNGTWQPLPTVKLAAGDKVELSVTVLGRTRLLDAASQLS